MSAENALVQISAVGSQYFSQSLGLVFDIRAKAASVSATYVEPEHADGFTTQNKFTVKEAKLAYEGLGNSLLLEGGLVNQQVQLNPLLVSRNAHLGVRQAFKLDTYFGTFTLSASQTRPLVSSYSESYEKVETQNLTFFNENVRYTNKFLNGLTFEIVLGHHAYNKLNPTVAYNSLFKGNTILGSSERNAEFAYGFHGWNYASYLNLDLASKWELNLSYLGIVNSKAPGGKSKGDALSAGLTLKNGVHHYSIDISHSDVESDAIVGTFTSYGDYKTNAITNNLWLGYENKKDNYSLRGVVQEYEIKNPVEYVQGDGTLFQLQLSKAYEIF